MNLKEGSHSQNPATVKTISSDHDMKNNKIINVKYATHSEDAVNLKQVNKGVA